MIADTSGAWWVTEADLLDYDSGNFADEAVEFGNWEAPDFELAVQAVADTIYEIHVGRDFQGKFLFAFECGPERTEVTGATVACSLPEQDGLFLTKFVDLKKTTTDRSATGWTQALCIKEALLDAYAQCRTVALACALLIDDEEAGESP